MKAFESLKRDFRGLYQSKSKIKKRDRAQTLDHGLIEALHGESAIPLASVGSTQLVDSEVTRPGTAPALQTEKSGHAFSDAHHGTVVPAGDDLDSPMEDQSDIKRPQSVLRITEATNNHGGGSSDIPSDHDQEAVAQNKEVGLLHDNIDSPMETRSDVEEPTGALDQEIAPEYDEENPEWTFEGAQSVRDQVYVSFSTEARDDYTDGPARFMVAQDGVKHCAALIMTFDLSQGIQGAIKGHREYLRAENAGLFHRQSLLRLEDDVQLEISRSYTRLALMQEEGRTESEDAQKLVQQREKLELMLEDVELRRQGVHNEVEFQATRLRSLQAAMNVQLEEAFVCANLMAQEEPEPEPEVENLDVQQEYEIFCRKLESAHDEPFEFAGPPLDTNTEHLEVPPPSEEEQAHQQVINALWAAKETLDLARRDFEEREDIRAREFQANQTAADRGEPTTDATPDDFDVRWVVRYGELTRDLINAEAAYADVKRSAFEAGVPLPFEDNETVCEAMDEDEGFEYTISKEQELVASVPSPTVRRWLDKVPEGMEVGSPSFGDGGRSESDEWEAEEVGISDSVSLVAEGRERARIDRWRQACVGEKRE
ncbi:hypothetical protein Q7P35_003548 [Cladosporium inversicolor]